MRAPIPSASLLLVLVACASVKPLSQPEQAYVDRLGATYSYPFTVTLAKDSAAIGRARALEFIRRHTVLPLQSNSETFISTEFGDVPQDDAYQVALTQLGDSVRFDVKVRARRVSPGDNRVPTTAGLRASMLADYIRTGTLPFPDLYYTY